MTEFRGAWSEEEVESFLHETTVPVRIATRRSDGSLWPVTVWYRYRDGFLECATQADADLVAILRNDPGVGFDVSTNEVPYRGIRGAASPRSRATAAVTSCANSSSATSAGQTPHWPGICSVTTATRSESGSIRVDL